MSETKKRSFVKSATWRFLATINGFVVAYIYLGSVAQSFKIAIIGNITGLILYYYHERIWNFIRWDKK
ncbi:MAG: DUF2061 domain-containing protein [Candidatus Parcubacteria bacterium]|nr:DUF2061 domain-containing protein [Candidatus Parcubacteria bacterium]